MHNTYIPFFKEVIIMSNACDVCGYRNSEVKPGGGFSDKGRNITLQVRMVGERVKQSVKFSGEPIKMTGNGTAARASRALGFRRF